jgi:phage terminase large subunit
MAMISVPGWARWLDVDVDNRGDPVRYRVLYGGRGGGKSWTIAFKLLERARRKRMRILCLREYDYSLGESSMKVIADVIERLGWGSSGDRFFKVTANEIRGGNGSLFVFVGLTGKDASIKSYEGFDLAWVEEAATVTQASLDALIPTIRKRGSEIWFSYNPRHATDPVDVKFRHDPPPGSIIVEVHHYDNPWFPEVLDREREHDRVRDPEKYAHIWKGGYVLRSDAQVFKRWSTHPFEAPQNAMICFGADWGHTHPTVLVRCFIGDWAGEAGASKVVANPKGGCLFVDYEAHQAGCSLDDTPALFAGTDTRHPKRWSNRWGHPGIELATQRKIIADSARPETIRFMNDRGFTVEAAKKGAGSIEEGIEFLKSFDIVVHPRCQNLIHELIHYSWAMDRHTGTILSKLADAHNHAVDALRYALEGARRGGGGIPRIYSTGRRDAFTQPPLAFAGPTTGGQLTTKGWGTVMSRRVKV